MSTLQIAAARVRMRVHPGYARRWIKRNWWRCITIALLITAGILVRAAVAGTRPESWPVGGEIVPCAICWALALAVALGEKR